MLIFSLSIVILSITEIYLFKNKSIKDIVVFSVFFLVAILLGFIYFSNPLNGSISTIILNLFNIKH